MISRARDLSGDLHVESAIDRLAEEFTGVFGRETVAACVVDSLERLGPTRIATYSSLLAHRFARERLRAAALAQGRVPRTTPVVLFVCHHNAGRSQLAASLMQQEASGRVEVLSAGTDPAAEVHASVTGVLLEEGLDPSTAFPKPLTDEVVQAADVVVTMGCGDSCPVVPGRRYVDWALPDPEGMTASQVRDLREDVRARVQVLLAELVGGGGL